MSAASPQAGGMTLLEVLRTAVHALRGNWLRSALTSLGVIIGIAAVIVMVSVGQGTQAEIEKDAASAACAPAAAISSRSPKRTPTPSVAKCRACSTSARCCAAARR
jgi:ABC-type lipoprotein release transport system permease subunit